MYVDMIYDNLCSCMQHYTLRHSAYLNHVALAKYHYEINCTFCRWCFIYSQATSQMFLSPLFSGQSQTFWVIIVDCGVNPNQQYNYKKRFYKSEPAWRFKHAGVFVPGKRQVCKQALTHTFTRQLQLNCHCGPGHWPGVHIPVSAQPPDWGE